MLIQQLRPQTVGKVARPGGFLEWSDTVMQLFLDILANCTPPSCIISNILSVTKVFLPKSDIIHQLPDVEFISLCRGNLSYLSKLLASDELARSPKFLEQHVDGTSRRQKEFQKKIIGIAKEGGFKHVTLDCCILSFDGTGEMVETVSSGPSKPSVRC